MIEVVDIDTLKSSEQAVRASEARYRAMFESTNVGMSETDVESGGLLRVNEQFARIIGYTAAELVGKTLLELTHPDDLPGNREAYSRLVRGEIPFYEIEKRLVRKDGTIVWVHVTVNLVRDAASRPLHTVVITLDITEHKRAEEALRETHAHLLSHAEELARFNRVAIGRELRMIELKKELDEVCRRHGEVARYPFELEQAIQEGGVEEPHSKTELPRDGLVPLESILCTEELDRRPSRPPDFETENRMLAAMTQALAESPRTILQTLAETIREVFKADSAGISLLSTDEKRFCWPAIAGVWKPHIGGGTPRDFGPCGDVLDRNTPLLFTHPERRYAALQATPPVEECLLVPFYVEGKAVGTIWAVAHDDRRKFDAEDLRQLVSLGRFASAAYQAVELKQAQDSRLAALNLMEDAVQSRQAMEKLNVALRENETELSEADRRKNEFLAMLGHELRNPLSALTHGLDLLGKVPDAGARLEELRGMMARQTKRMATLLDQLLDLARVSSGKVELSKGCIDLADVVQAAVETMRPLVESQRHNLTVSLPPVKSALVLGDAVRLTQVVENLLTNAAKYTDEGGQIALTLEADKDKVRIIIRDSGIGMSAELLPHIFEVFTQASRTLDRVKGGMGLGLPLVWRLVEMHEGQVNASSPGLGQGSEFIVTLPRLWDGHSKERRSPAEPRAQSRRILVVDDEKDMAEAFALVLKYDGHETLSVNDGASAVEAARTFDPEVVLLDLGLPEMDGYEVAKRLRAQGGRQKLLIAVTGYQRDDARLKEAGFDEHLIKPPNLRMLTALLANWDYGEPRTEQSKPPTEASEHSAKRESKVLSGDGEMHALIRGKDWAATSLGPIETWSATLLNTVNLCLSVNFPMSMAWGPGCVLLYNDRYRIHACGAKHPTSLGQDFRECWASGWAVLGPLFDAALAGKSAYLENQRMFLDRDGYLEETFWTFSFSPIRDENGQVAGLLNPCTDTTADILNQRRTRALRDVVHRTVNAATRDEVYALTANALGEYGLDLPFALLYKLDSDGHCLGLGASTGVDPALVAGFEWPIDEMLRSGHPIELNLVERFGSALIAGPYPEGARHAVALPITPPGHRLPAAVLIAGVSARRLLDEQYRAFYDLLGAAVTTSLANAIAREEEGQRAEALAAIDRAKTAFFSNVSHEFRTPLTLMLGPTEDLLTGVHGPLPEAHRTQLELLHRNELRLHKLVNALLDFSRIEAGRIQASYEPVDLSGDTRDLASAFRSAVEHAGLTLTVDCPPLDEPVFVDREMWEKIVLNLLSNALKFTFEGGIDVSLQSTNEIVVLRVKDTGVGVPEEEVPRLFERFHRVAGTKARTHEGSGIGLALVQELVKLHGGSVHAESQLDVGTTFTVTIPKGSAHLPKDRIGAARTMASTALGAAPFVEEALRWLPGEAGTAPAPSDGHRTSVQVEVASTPRSSERILFADDNADMRDYVRRILESRWTVETVEDGTKALAAAEANPPDLVLTDIMMPGLDGFELLRRLREGERTRTVPVVMLSARAGDEAKVGGLEAGADDYVIKPFSARELVARVRIQLDLSRLRREGELLISELQESVRFSEMFVGVLGHDLRSPLGAIIMTSDLLLRRETRESLVHPIQRIQTSAERMARMIEQILDLTRARIGGGISIEPTPVDLEGLARPLVEELEGTAPRRIVLESIGDMRGEWDGDRLAQVISNLLGNAVDHGEANEPIRLKLDGSDPRFARLLVWNAGVVPEKLLPTLFDPFRGAARSGKPRKSKGLGLGLYIVEQVVQAHGGRIEVRSSANEGTTFSVLIPRKALPRAGDARNRTAS